MDRSAQQQLLMEVATACQQGLSINRPEPRLVLLQDKSGQPISHLQAAYLLFVGVTQLLPQG